MWKMFYVVMLCLWWVVWIILIIENIIVEWNGFVLIWNVKIFQLIFVSIVSGIMVWIWMLWIMKGNDNQNENDEHF